MLELEDISIIPSELNNGTTLRPKFNFGVQDIEPSLPIFTAPMDSVVGKENWKVWQENGIRPVIPRTEPLELRLEACCFIFAEFSKDEIKRSFIMSNRRAINSMLRICFDNSGNGHDVEVLNMAKELRRIYGPQVLLMGGNIGNPKTYIDYCRADFDYVRVGLGSGSLVDKKKYGFYYPMASLLIDVEGTKKTAGIGLKQPKIIADGGIESPSDIIKCIALGADYVMIGHEFAKLLEANGEIYREVYDAKAKTNSHVPVPREELVKAPKDSLGRMALSRTYRATSDPHTQALKLGFQELEDMEAKGIQREPVDGVSKRVYINSTLGDWLKDMYDCFSYAFTMTSSTDWKTFKNNAKYIQL